MSDRLAAAFGTYDSYIRALELAVNDQIKADIDLISDGQVRGNMLEIYANEIPGMKSDDGKPVIVGKIQPAPHSIGSNDLSLALKIARKLNPRFKNNTPLLSHHEFQANFKGIKGIITGPTTLVLSSRIEGFYDKTEKDRAIIDLAWALKKEVEHLQNSGAAVIQIDEPFLSTGIADLKTARKAVEIISQDVKKPVSMHVCGTIKEVLAELLRFKVDIIDCEFAGEKHNLGALENIDLNKKKIGLGCIDTKTDEVESKQSVVTIIKKAIDTIGDENLIADPDCGLRLRSRDAAYSKLKVMVEAVKWLS